MDSRMVQAKDLEVISGHAVDSVQIKDLNRHVVDSVLIEEELNGQSAVHLDRTKDLGTIRDLMVDSVPIVGKGAIRDGEDLVRTKGLDPIKDGEDLARTKGRDPTKEGEDLVRTKGQDPIKDPMITVLMVKGLDPIRDPMIMVLMVKGLDPIKDPMITVLMGTISAVQMVMMTMTQMIISVLTKMVLEGQTVLAETRVQTIITNSMKLLQILSRETKPLVHFRDPRIGVLETLGEQLSEPIRC